MPSTQGKREKARGQRIKKIVPGLVFLLPLTVPLLPAFSSEVLKQSPTCVLVREHPKTGKPYVVITPDGKEPVNVLGRPDRAFSPTMRPDYRMLDPKVKRGEIPYEGPSSDRKKVYFLAASLAAGGVAGAALLPVSAATGAGAASGAGAFAGAGVGVAAATAGTVTYATRERPEDEEFTQTAESKKRGQVGSV